VINAALDVKRLINQQSGDVNTWHLAVTIKGSKLDLLQKLQNTLGESVRNSELCEILQVGSVTLLQTDNHDLEIALTTLQTSLCPRCRRYSLDESPEQETCHRCSEVLEARN